VARQAAWRTGFEVRDGTPVQVVRPSATLPLDRVDLGDLTPDAAEQRMRADATLRAAQPFDLATPPLVRAALYRFPEDEHRLLIVVHHTVFDGGSAQVLLRDLAAFYGDGRPEPDPLPVSYRDFSTWERAELTADRSAALSEFWQDELNGVIPVFAEAIGSGAIGSETTGSRAALGADAAGSATSYRTAVPAGTVAGIRRLGQQLQASTFMILLAGLDALVARRTGVTDVTVGVPTSNRRYRGSEHLIGYFLNLVPIRVRGESGASFADLVGNAKASTLRAYEHQQLPYPLIKKAAKLPGLELLLAIGPVHRRVAIGDAEVDLDVRDFGAEVAASSIVVYEHDDGLDIEAFCPAEPTALGTPDVLVGELLALLADAVEEPAKCYGAPAAEPVHP
jgi:hypothetical protein